MAITLAVVGKFNDKDLKKAEASLAKLKREALLAASPMARLGVQFENAGKKMQAVGGNLTKYVTAPIGGLAVAAGASFMKVDEGLDTVAARSGVTGAALTGLQDTFKDVAKTATQDMTTVGEVVGGLAGKLGLTGKPLQDLSSDILNLARVTGVDATTATDAVAKAVNGLGISGAQTGKFLDDLLVASQKSGISVDQLAATLAATGPAFKTMGIDTTDATALIAAFERAGLPTTRMVAGLTAATAKFAKDGIKDIPGALADTIKQIKSAGSESDATAIAVETFGARAGVALGGAIRSGALNLEDLTKALDDSTGALDRTVAATDGPEEQFARLKNQFMLAGASIAEAMLPAVERIVPVIQSLAQKFTALSPGVKTAIVVAGGLVAALGPVLSVVGNVTMVLGKFMQITKLATAVTKIWTGVQAAFNLVMSANPLVLVGLAIAALVAGVVIAYKKFDWFRELVDRIGRFLRDKFVAAWDAVKRAVSTAVSVMTSVWNGFKTAVGVVVDAITWYFNAYKTVVTTVVGVVRDGIGRVVDFFMDVPGKIAALPGKVLQIGKDMVTGLWEGMTGMRSWLWGKIKEFVGSTIPGWMKGVLGISSPSRVTAAIGEDMARGMAVGMDKRGKDVKNAGDKLAKTAVDAAKKRAEEAKRVFDTLKGAANNALDKVKDRAQNVLDFAGDVSRSITGYGSISTFEADDRKPTTAQSVIGNMSARLATIKKFGQQLQDLRSLGLNNTSLQDIIAAGPEAGSQIAAALLKEGASAIGQVNDLESQLAGAASGIGDFSAQSQFGQSVGEAQTVIDSSITVQAGAVVVNIGAGVDATTAASIRAEVAGAVQTAIDELGQKAVSEAQKTVAQSLKSVKKAVSTAKPSTRRGR